MWAIRFRIEVAVGIVSLCLVVLAAGCSGGQSSGSNLNPNSNSNVPSIVFISSGALDGSNKPDGLCPPIFSNTTVRFDNPFNIWGWDAKGGPRPFTNATICQTAYMNPVWSPDGSKVALLSNQGNVASQPDEFDIWVMNSDGTGIRPLTNFAAPNFPDVPTWSPDSTTLAFSAGTGFWTIKPDGTGLTELTQLLHVIKSHLAWSPDGHKIAFLSNQALDGSDSAIPGTNVWVMNADGSGALPLTKFSFAGGANTFFGLSWSTDSSEIAFTSDAALDGSNTSNGQSNIWVVKADGTNATPLTKLTSAAPVGASDAAWSPDGKKIAYGSGGAAAPSVPNIWVINSDGTGATQLTQFTDAVISSLPSWSPDGTQLAFVSDHPVDASMTHERNVWLVNSDGSGLTALTHFSSGVGANGMAQASQPVWRH